MVGRLLRSFGYWHSQVVEYSDDCRGLHVKNFLTAKIAIRLNRFQHMLIALSLVPLTTGAMLGATTVMARIIIVPPDTVARQSTSQGDWHLTIARDKFSGELACQLKSRDGRGLYRSGGVGFKFHFVRTVTDAVYRIDRGDAHASRDDLPRLIALNTPIDHGSMADPSDGVADCPMTGSPGRMRSRSSRNAAIRSAYFICADWPRCTTWL